MSEDSLLRDELADLLLRVHHPRTSLIAAKTSSWVRSAVKVAVKSLLVRVFVLFLNRALVAVGARCVETTESNPSAQLRQSSLRPPHATARPVGRRRSRLPAWPAVYVQGSADPVSSRVFRLARTAGHPFEIPRRTSLPGTKPGNRRAV